MRLRILLFSCFCLTLFSLAPVLMTPGIPVGVLQAQEAEKTPEAEKAEVEKESEKPAEEKPSPGKTAPEETPADSSSKAEEPDAPTSEEKAEPPTKEETPETKESTTEETPVEATEKESEETAPEEAESETGENSSSEKPEDVRRFEMATEMLDGLLESLELRVEYYKQEEWKNLIEKITALRDSSQKETEETSRKELVQLHALLVEARLMVYSLISLKSTTLPKSQELGRVQEALRKAHDELNSSAEDRVLKALQVLQTERVQNEIAMQQERKGIDWVHWRKLPVLHDGRMMPLDTFADEAVTLVVGRSTWTDPLSEAGSTKLKYTAPELVFLWANDSKFEWLYRPVIRCEFQPLRRLLDARLVTGETLEAKGTETTTVTFGEIAHASLAKGSLSGTLMLDGLPAVKFKTSSDGLFIFSSVADATKPVGDSPLVQRVSGADNSGWYGSLIQRAFTETDVPLPTSGQVDWETGEITINFEKPPSGAVSCVVDYEYYRHIIPEKGKFISIVEIMDLSKLGSGDENSAYWSAGLGKRLNILDRASKDNKLPSQIGETPAERELNKNIAEFFKHVRSFMGIIEARNLYLLPGFDPRVLTKQTNPDAKLPHWMSLATLLNPNGWGRGDSPTMASLMAENPEKLYELVSKGRYPQENFLQLAQAQNYKYQFQNDLNEIPRMLETLSKNYREGEAAEFNKNSEQFGIHLRKLAIRLQSLRSELGPVNLEKEYGLNNSDIEFLKTVFSENREGGITREMTDKVTHLYEKLNRARFVNLIETMRTLKTVIASDEFQAAANTPEKVKLFQQLRGEDTQSMLDTIRLLDDALRAKQYPPEDKLADFRTLVERTVQQCLALDPELATRVPELFHTVLDVGTQTFRVIAATKPMELHEHQMSLTFYPEPGSTDLELLYNDKKPFAWAWVMFLGAFVVVIFSLMVKTQRFVYMLGLAASAAAIAWSAWGFGLRILITQRAPVTNMYETVVWVSFIVAALGFWFCILPLVWPGLSWGWRLSGLPVRGKRNPTGRLSGIELDAPAPEEQGRLLADHLTILQTIFSAVRLGVFGYIVWYLTASDTTFNITTLVPPIFGKTISIGKFFTWLVGISTVLISSWFISHLAVSLVASVATIAPETSRESEKLWDQTFARRWFLLGALPVACMGMMLAHFVGNHSPDILNPGIGSISAVLRNNYWLTIHVLTIVSSYGAGALAWGLGNLGMAYYLFGKYRSPETDQEFLIKQAEEGHVPVTTASDAEAETLGANDTLSSRMGKAFGALGPRRIGETIKTGFRGWGKGDEHLSASKVRPPKEVVTLANFGYKAMQVAVLLLAVGTILGGLWADVSWGRFWDWDPKEVWALISLLVYLAVLHGRFAGWVGTFGTNVGSVLCFNAIMMSWYGVNYILPKIPGWLDGTGDTVSVGLHSYASGDTKGMAYIIGAMLLNTAFVLAAWGRYAVETNLVQHGGNSGSVPPPKPNAGEV